MCRNTSGFPHHIRVAPLAAQCYENQGENKEVSSSFLSPPAPLQFLETSRFCFCVGPFFRACGEAADFRNSSPGQGTCELNCSHCAPRLIDLSVHNISKQQETKPPTLTSFEKIRPQRRGKKEQETANVFVFTSLMSFT